MSELMSRSRIARPAAGALALLVALVLGTGLAMAQDEEAPPENKLTFEKNPPIKGRVEPNSGFFRLPMPPAPKDWKPNTFMPAISAQAKMRAMQTMMMANPFSLRQMINMMVAKKKAAPGLSFDDVIESLKTRANALNFRLVNHNTPWKLIQAITGKPTPRLEILAFCDLITLRQIVDYVPEFAAFLPCRVVVMEDAKGDIWLVTLDWDVRWLDTSQVPDRISDELRKRAMKVRENIEEIMEAGANGDL